MAGRIRTLKPEILEDEKTAGLSDTAFRLFVSLILLADDHGNLRAQPSWLTGVIFWAREAGAPVGEAIAEIERAGLVRLYREREQLYAHIRGWSKNQRIDKIGRPRVPKPPPEDVIEKPGENDDVGQIRDSLASVSRLPRECLATSSRLSRETLANDLRSPTTDLRPPISDHDPDARVGGESKANESAGQDDHELTNPQPAAASPPAEPGKPATPLATTDLEPVKVKPADRPELALPIPVGGNKPHPTTDRPRGVQPNSWRQFGGMWTDIYASAVSYELGTNWAFKDVRTEATLERLLNLHCLGPDANPDKVEGWIRRHVKLLVTFVRENDDEEPSYWSSYAPNGIIRFLNEGHHRAKQPEPVKATTKPENPPAEELRPGTDEEIRSVLDSLKAMGHRGIQMPSSRAATEDEEPTPPEELEARRLEQLRKLEEFRKQCEGS